LWIGDGQVMVANGFTPLLALSLLRRKLTYRG